MKKYLKIYTRIFKLSAMNEMINRENFWTWAIIHSLTMVSMILFFKIIYGGTSSINGWTEYQSLLVLGVGSLVTGLGSLTFFPFMYNFGRDIDEGDLDMRLLKPLDILFQSAFNLVDFEDFIVVPNSLLLIVYALWKLHPSHLLINIIGFIPIFISGMVILFSLLTLIQSLAFKLIKVDSVASFYWSIVNISKYPAKAIKGIGLIGTTLLVPIAVISSLPAEILFGRWDWIWIVGSIISAIILFILSRWVFMSSLRHYSSASS